ncbi:MULTISPECIES: helix-turn-helix transcriptional regulator [unclassified Lactococcus]|uniref:helix-turn-helix transcriptional regulator n=1 Tax=unclassified Lactococcus TaxID=2643510 RepID=UPI0011C7DA46|nr:MULTISPECIES: helix-turn-helix transcriptional regulator [unclassified Lactococcus]MQW23704.1 helix-turn-helix domain-containing protein [Lactococcus sp. dk101]TXK37536.1 helix-turn-helix transcriptional regulator [Lactococcus sp. dk310]TXK48946.1 helix-turn-helix transcriptional regulator [Lactococcus sp. dk322]
MENKIRELRRLNHLSQEDVAHIAHVSRQTINAIENDKYDPELTLAFKLAEILNTKVDDLFNYRQSVAQRKESTVYWCEKYQCVLLKRAGVEKKTVEKAKM